MPQTPTPYPPINGQPHFSETRILHGVCSVIAGPLRDIAHRLSTFISEIAPHTALIIFTKECTGTPRKVSGDPSIVDRATLAELETIRESIRGTEFYDGLATLAGTAHQVWAFVDPGGSLLIVVPKRGNLPPRERCAIRAVFSIVNTSIEQQVAHASPSYLAESIAASTERARTITELSEAYSVTLESLLATLRSRSLDDRSARIAATETASHALVDLRSASQRNKRFSEETIAFAFGRLKCEVGSLINDQSITVEYVEPPATGLTLPGEVARAARAVLRSLILALLAQPQLSRIRISWESDPYALQINVRDDAAGALNVAVLKRQITSRLSALHGSIEIESVTGWGLEARCTIPLRPPTVRAEETDESLVSALNPRELEVLGYLAIGKRNRVIADSLGISESTVKFHVARVMRKLGVSTRGEAGAVGMRSGIRASS